MSVMPVFGGRRNNEQQVHDPYSEHHAKVHDPYSDHHAKVHDPYSEHHAKVHDPYYHRTHEVYYPYTHQHAHQVHNPFAHEVWSSVHEFDLETPRSLIAPAPRFHHGPATMAQIEYKETPEAHIFRCNLHGYKKEDVKVQVEDDKVLKITGERRMKKEDNWHHYELSSGKFFTSFSLPVNSRVDYVKSSMDNGVLTITIPKKEINRNHHHLRTLQIN